MCPCGFDVQRGFQGVSELCQRLLCQAKSRGLLQVYPVEVSMPFGMAVLILALVGPKLSTMSHPHDQPQGAVAGQEQKMTYVILMILVNAELV